MRDLTKENMAEITLEEIEFQFVDDWERGATPDIAALMQRYPQFADDLEEFVIDFLAFQNAVDSLPQSTTVSEGAKAVLADVMSMASANPKDLTEALKAKRWRAPELAKALNLPMQLTLRTMRGYEVWGDKIVNKVASVLSVSHAQARAILANTHAAPAAGYMASGQPHQSRKKRKSFEEDLQESYHLGELTPEQQAEWLS